ncbi:MAG: lytic transglycosylase domain-containing protein [Candidatus Binataceae bacterium]
MLGLMLAVALYGGVASAQDQRTHSQDRPLDARAMLTAVGNLYDIDPGLLAAIAHVESDWQLDAISPAGAIGLMQLMPATAKRFDANPYSPVDNALGAARYISSLKKRYRSSPDALVKVLAAYNAGPEAVQRYDGIPPYAETQAYVRRVLWLYLTGTTPAAVDTYVTDRAHTTYHEPAAARHVVSRGSATTDAQILDELQTLRRQRSEAR